MRFVIPLAALAVTACTTGGPRPATPARVHVPVPITVPGLSGVIGHDAAQLIRSFGQPDLDVTEGTGRKLQFGSAICVLDAYLYPPASGHGAPVVTHVDARQRDGSAIDRASCVAALQRKGGGR